MKARRGVAFLAGLVVAAGLVTVAPPGSADGGALPLASRFLLTPGFVSGPCSIEADRAASSPHARIAVSDETSCTPRSSCCKVCSTGKACGDSCISRSYICRKEKGCACNSEDVCDEHFAAIAEAPPRPSAGVVSALH